jgi:hypothetical protein
MLVGRVAVGALEQPHTIPSAVTAAAHEIIAYRIPRMCLTSSDHHRKGGTNACQGPNRIA